MELSVISAQYFCKPKIPLKSLINLKSIEK